MQASPIKPDVMSELARDTVNFKSLKNMAQIHFDELNTAIKNEVEPFMADSKELYYEVGKIGFNAQEALKIFNQRELELMLHKFEIANVEKNPSLAQYKPFEDRKHAYNKNIADLDRLTVMAKQTMYNTPEIAVAIEEASNIVFKKDKEIEKMLPLNKFYFETILNLQRRLDDFRLFDANKKMSDSYEDIKDKLLMSQVYMVWMPYSDCSKLLKDCDSLKGVISNPKISILEKLKAIDIAQRKTQKIAEDKNIFYEKKEKISDFVKKNENYELDTPKPAVINKVYDELIAGCDSYAVDAVRKIDDFYKREYADQNVKINLKLVDNHLKEQSQAINKVQKLINKIKEEYIAKNNEEFMKKFGHQD